MDPVTAIHVGSGDSGPVYVVPGSGRVAGLESRGPSSTVIYFSSGGSLAVSAAVSAVAASLNITLPS
jgi:hypothetical protein